MAEGIIGLGTLLKIDDGGAPENFTAIAEVKDITSPGRPPANRDGKRSDGSFLRISAASFPSDPFPS